MKKAWNIIKNIFVWLVMLAALGMMIFTIFATTTFDRSERQVFGYSFFIVRSDSMSATDFKAGDIIFVKSVDASTLKEGDIISYVSQDSENYGETITHKIRSMTVTANGEAGFITYGTTTNTDDPEIVTYPYVIGKYIGHVPNIGTFFAFLKSVPGYILCIFLPFLILIVYNTYNCVSLFYQYKREVATELMQEKEQLEEERRQSEEMKKELERLRSQLAQSQSDEQGVDVETSQA